MPAAKDINSIMAGWVDRGPWIYWDTLVVPVATTLASSYSMFSVPIGQVDPVSGAVKTKLQTNMKRGNQFPPPRCLVLMQLGFDFGAEMLKADIDNVINGAYIEFRIDEKIFFEGLMHMFPAGMGIFGQSTKTNESAWVNGIPAPQNTRRYNEYSKYIAPLQQFELTITFPGTPPTTTAAASGGTGLRLRPMMDGLTDRAVQ